MIFFKKYKVELLILALHLGGPTIGKLGVLFAFLYSLKLVGFTRSIDLVQLFLLLIPGMVLGIASEDQAVQESSGWFKVYIPTLVNVFIIGPFALSAKLGMAFGVFFRLFLYLKRQTHFFIFILWIVALITSIYGLYLAKSLDLESAGGLTVGLRIALSIGAVLIPLGMTRESLEDNLILISKLSIILFFSGLLIDHWIFVTVALAPILYYSKPNLFWKACSILMTLIMLFSDTTFTLKLIVILSWLLIFIYNRIGVVRTVLTSYIGKAALIAFPILMVFFVIGNDLLNENFQDNNSLIERFKFKLFLDRGHVWEEAYRLIINSDFFAVPAGRDIEIYNSNVYSDNDWGAGAHNIFLEIGRQNGAFVLLIIMFMIAFFIFKSFNRNLRHGILCNYLIASIVVYAVYGFTGNSLVYDGVGFFFWLIIGQIYLIQKPGSYYEDTTSLSSE